MLTNVPLEADVFNNEPFGPVAAVRGFDTLEEAIAEANRLPLRPRGLCVHASRSATRTCCRSSMEVGMLWINQPATPTPEMPFGGVKDSGYGSEGGPEAMEAYLVTKTVSTTVRRGSSHSRKRTLTMAPARREPARLGHQWIPKIPAYICCTFIKQLRITR